MTPFLAARGTGCGRPESGAVRAAVLALGIALPAALAADTRYGQWPPQGPRGDYRGDDTYRDPRGSSPGPRYEWDGPTARSDTAGAPVRAYGWERGGTTELPGGYDSGWGGPRSPGSDGSWPSRTWGSEPRPSADPGTARGTRGYSPWEIRGDRPWARQDGSRGEWRSDRLPEPPPVPPPPPPHLPYSPYGLDPYLGGTGYPSVRENTRPPY